MARIALADETTDARYAAAAVALHRESVRFLISAILLSQDATLAGVPLALRAGADKLEELVQAGVLPALPKRYAETLAILDGQLVRVGKENCIIPLTSISESLQIESRPVSAAPSGSRVALQVPESVRRGDKLYVMRPR